ncbi:MAG: M48 family metallopeptidase, partial [Chloroflexi bacterium]|nr:M48 family metallopeptidase [Chloroflexota bacterium]
MTAQAPTAPRHARSAPPDSQRERAAAQLGAERRRLWLVGVVISLAAPLVPYLTGTWETVWYGVAATPLPFAASVVFFLVFVHLALSIVALPLGYYGGFVLSHAFGLSRQTKTAWAIDWLKGTLVAVLLGTLFGGAFLWTVIAAGPNWWWVFGIAASIAGLALVFVMPYVLVPLFFKMRPLEDVETVARIHALVNRAGAPVKDICTLDFSRRTAEANAAVIGLGRSRRVVLADTLLAEFSPAEVDAVVAHELGHHVHRDVQRLLIGNAVLMWAGLAFAAWLRPLALPLLSLPSLAYVPGYPVLLFAVQLFYLVMSPLLNWWSRQLEARADRFALGLTRDPAAFVMAMERIGSQNLAERRPPRWAEVLLATHPPLYRRIDMAR